MHYPNDIEECCYEQSHIDEVLMEMNKNIPQYFTQYIESEGNNHSVTNDAIKHLAAHFGSSAKPKVKVKNAKIVLQRILDESVAAFNDERGPYLEHLDLEALEEYGQDVGSFKNTTLQHQIPIIRKTLQNKKAKELDKFRAAFNKAQPGDMFNVTQNIVSTAHTWRNEWYDERTFSSISTCEELDYHDFDEDGYTVFGVIGGGIKSHFAYKLFPEMFPNRSREAVWALWYLSNKKTFACKQDSEFLMIDTKEGTTQQNYFYPYGLFSFYALKIFNELEVLFKENGISLAGDHRFIIVNGFLLFIARKHQKEIDLLKQNAQNEYYDY